MLNSQETFDKVKSHLLMQGRRAMRSPSICAYKAPNGDKCAVGCLIPDDKYVTKMENCSISEAVLSVVLAEVTTAPVDLLRELQNIHDYTDVELWEGRLNNVAQVYGLNYAE